MITGLQPAGLSHSEIPGSMVICTYPRLIAAYHVLHRLHEPRHPPCALSYFLYDISFSSALLPRSAEPLILSAVLIVKYSLLGLPTLRSTSLKLKLKSYFLQFVLCQYVKDLLHLPFTMYNVQFVLAMRRGDSGIEPGLQPFLLYMLNRFAYKKHWV